LLGVQVKLTELVAVRSKNPVGKLEHWDVTGLAYKKGAQYGSFKFRNPVPKGLKAPNQHTIAISSVPAGEMTYSAIGAANCPPPPSGDTLTFRVSGFGITNDNVNTQSPFPSHTDEFILQADGTVLINGGPYKKGYGTYYWQTRSQVVDKKEYLLTYQIVHKYNIDSGCRNL
jgi:hypothetical protein